MKPIALLLFGICVVVSGGSAVYADEHGPFSTKALFSLCEPLGSQSADQIESANLLCDTYLMGVADGMFILKAAQANGEGMCAPLDSPISTSRARELFVEYVREHPEANTYSAGIVAPMSLIRAYPCR